MKCETCGGGGILLHGAPADVSDLYRVNHPRCLHCNGSGQQPDAPAPVAPARLAACHREAIRDLYDSTTDPAAHEAIEAMYTLLTRQAQQMDAAEAKLAKLRAYVSGPLIPTGDPVYDNGRDTVRCEVLAIIGGKE